MATAKKDDITRLVKIKLFKDKDKYSEDVTVVVNGTTFRIQRGVEVEDVYNRQAYERQIKLSGTCV